MSEFVAGNPLGYAWNGNTWAPDPMRTASKSVKGCRLNYGGRLKINVRSTKAHDSGYVGCSLRTEGDYVKDGLERTRTRYEKRKAILDELAAQGLLA